MYIILHYRLEVRRTQSQWAASS